MFRTLVYTLVHLIAAFAFVCGVVYVYTAIATPFTFVLQSASAQQLTLVYVQAAYYAVIALALFLFALAIEVSIRFATINRRHAETAKRSEYVLTVVAANTKKTVTVLRQVGKLLSARQRGTAPRQPAVRTTPPPAIEDFKSVDDLFDET